MDWIRDAFGGTKVLTVRTGTRRVFCGGVPIGGDAPVTIQSMTNTDTGDVVKTTAQVRELAAAGADIVRVAVPTLEAARRFSEIKSGAEGVPLVADVHFDFRIALEVIRAGADKVRVNPGNIGGAEHLKAVCDAAGTAGIPMRIGVNAGSLEEDLRGLYESRPAEALAESVFRNIEIVRGMGFEDLVVSVKSSDVLISTEAHRLLAAGTDFPLHIGITEAGFGAAALAKSAAGIGALLAMGIGDTVRVSLTGDPVFEITAARDILRSFGLLPGGVTLVSCPTCGRCRVDLAKICEEVSEALAGIESERICSAKQGHNLRSLTVAVMGCAVNGPGEAAHADVGVACGADGGVYFEKGVRGDAVPADKIVETLVEGIRSIRD